MTYSHLPSVEGHWDQDDWHYVFGTPEWTSVPVFESAAPAESQPVEPFGPGDIAEVTNIWAISRQAWADQTMYALVRLHDDRWAAIETWSDSSGYGCRDASTWKVGSREDVLRWGLSDEARERLAVST